MNTTTLLTIFLHPGNEEQARYLIEKETLSPGGTFYTATSKPEERVPLDRAAPFTFSYAEKQVVFVLYQPLTPAQIKDLAAYVTVGHIYGFTVKGAIDLGETIINNLEDSLEFLLTLTLAH